MRALVAVALSVTAILAGTAFANAADLPESNPPQYAPRHSMPAPEYAPSRHGCNSPCHAPVYYAPRDTSDYCTPCGYRPGLLAFLFQTEIIAPHYWHAPWHHGYYAPMIGVAPRIGRHGHMSRHMWRHGYHHGRLIALRHGRQHGRMHGAPRRMYIR